MDLHTFPLAGEYIELNALLKRLALTASGGEAKALIAGGTVRVNGEREMRIRRKLRVGDVVGVGEASIRIVAEE